MINDLKKAILDRFVYTGESVPRNYGQRIPLRQFLKEVEEGHHKTFMGDGELVLHGKIIENSRVWVNERVIRFRDLTVSLEKVGELIEELEVFWVSETDLLF